MELFLFLMQVFIISFSGAMSPGPVTASCLAIGPHNRYAGTLIAIGHGIIEFPLMIIIMLGMGQLLQSKLIQSIIAIIGSAVLFYMAFGMLKNLKNSSEHDYKTFRQKPILAGIILSATNPYFLIWWVTIGLTLALQAKSFGVWAFGLFALTHWLCDAVWFQVLSYSSYKGTQLLGPKSYKILLFICAAALLVFAGIFMYNAVGDFVKLI